MKAAQLEIGVLRRRRQEAGGRRQEAEGRSQKKCFYKYEMLSRGREIAKLNINNCGLVEMRATCASCIINYSKTEKNLVKP